MTTTGGPHSRGKRGENSSKMKMISGLQKTDQGPDTNFLVGQNTWTLLRAQYQQSILLRNTGPLRSLEGVKKVLTIKKIGSVLLL